jgi:protein-S-isoprenylcysteine O-methyltransferase
LRFYAIRVLGRFFTATVQIQADHRLVTRGPYSRIRHPSYLGALAAFAGHALLLFAPLCAFVVTIGMFLVYRQRIQLEEAVLQESLGAVYGDYQSKTTRLLPGVW